MSKMKTFADIADIDPETPEPARGLLSKRNIIPCIVEDPHCSYRYGWDGTRKPITLEEIDLDWLMERRVIRVHFALGTYGMGGPGFFGLELEAHKDRPIEWLVLCLWGAAEWLLLDNRWVDAPPDQSQPPLKEQETKNLLTDSFIGGVKITDAMIEIYFYEVKDVSGNRYHNHILTIPEDKALLPPHYSGEPRFWHFEESMFDAWVLSDSQYLVLTGE